MFTMTMPDIARDAFVLAVERQLEALDAGLMFCSVRVGLQVQFVVVAAGNDHVRLQSA